MRVPVELTELLRQLLREVLEPLAALPPDRRGDGPRLDHGDSDAERPELDAQHIGDGFQCVLRRCVGAEERQRAATRDRADVYDPSPCRAEIRQQGLRDRDVADEVHLELTAELVEREELERHRKRGPGVVDETVQRLVPECCGGCRDRRRFGHVDRHGLEPLAGCGAQAVAVCVGANAGKYTPAGAREPECSRLADSG